MTGAGDVLAAVNDEKTLVPASNMKLISTGAALFALGPEYRFSTEIAHDGHISEGTLHGNLYIVGGTQNVVILYFSSFERISAPSNLSKS